MSFDHSRLVGKIRQEGLTQEKVAKKLRISTSTMNMKLKNKARFTSEEIASLCELLNIPFDEIGSYFFCLES